ncbi:MAG: cation diffusion facilitator family transporter [Candidatus Nanopelagicales bacterium]|nr:cation diffusion facilitator family transporter [Candidatus Nanopelagicales bacterium]
MAELVGAWLTGSLALLADAGHMFTDVAGILLAVLAVTFAAKPATAKRTYGYYRLEILAAVVNAVLLFGLVANLIGLSILRAGSKQSLNVKGAYLEVLGDALGSVAVIVAAILIATTGWLRADAIASVLVALMILPRTWALLREAVDVLLQATPEGMDLTEVRQHIIETAGVIDAHDLHAWTLTSGKPVLSVHVVVGDEVLANGSSEEVLDALGACLHEHFDVDHCTFQLEPSHHGTHERDLHQ